MTLPKLLTLVLVAITFSAQAQNIGVKTSTPNATLDVNGSVAMREGTPLSTTSGVNNNVAIDSMSFYRITAPTAAFSITGFTAGFDGRMLTVVNATNYVMTIKHFSASSTAANRINTGGSDLTVAANGIINLYYSSSMSNWMVASSQGTPPNLTTIGTGGSGDSILVINNGVPGKVPPKTFIDYYAWGLEGNAGTVDGTHFIGTLDNIPFNIRVNNQKSGRIDPISGTTAFGYLSNASATTGGSNVAIGHQALRNNTTGSQNVVLGYQSGALVTTGSNNTLLGYGANVTSAGGAFTNATALGYNAIVGASNSLVLGGTGASAVSVGIGTQTPLSTARLHVENTGTGYAFYAPIGTNYNHIAGRAAFGRATTDPSVTYQGASADALWHFQDSITTLGSNISEGIGIKLRVSPSSASSSGLAYGLNVRTHVPSYNSQPIGVVEAANLDFRHYGTGTITNSYGAIARSVNLSTGRIMKSQGLNVDIGNYGGTIDSMWGILIGGGTFGTQTNAVVGIGLHVGDIYATTAYGIWQGGADDKNFFAGNVGINTTTPQYKLDIDAQTSSAGNPLRLLGLSAGATTDSLLTSASGVVRRVAFSQFSGASSGWGLTGNSSTVDGTNFLGTTDNVPLNFRVNNQKAGRIDIVNKATFLGYQAGNVNASTDNTFIGYQAGRLNTSGESNTAVGSGALATVTSGKDNVAIGYYALNVNTGDDNTAVGKLALSLNTSGTHNVAVGEGSMERNTTGVQNTALGRQSLQYNTLARDNTALGYSAMLNNTTAERNVAVGKNALIAQSFNNSGSVYNTQNVAVGYEALAVNQPTSSSNGINNTAVGYQSGKANTTGTNNTFIGNYAGEVNTTGSNNVTLGYQGGNNITTGSNNIAIGYVAQVPTATASDQLSIGNWLYGVSGNIGVGTSTPVNKIDVEGGAAIGVNYSGTRTAPTNGLLVEGNVGINNFVGGSQYSSPVYQLSVNRYHTDAGSNTPLGLLSYNSGTSPSAVGAASLHFQTALGTYAAPTAVTSTALLGVIGFGGYDGTGFAFPNFATMEARASQNWTTTAKGTYMTFQTTPNGSTTNAERMRIDQNGNVGIGTTSVTQRLTVFNGTSTGTYTTTGWVHTSDERLKTNIKPLSKALDKVMAMQGVYFNWKTTPNTDLQVGFIAQQVEPIVPEVVLTDDKGMKSMSYGNLTAVHNEAIKEQQKQIEALKKEKEALNAELNTLKTALNKQGNLTEGLINRLEKLEAALTAKPVQQSSDKTEKK